MSFSAADHEFMARALRLARRGLCTTTPNPRVGCVLVKDGTIVGEGWHERAGEPHAEVNALRAAGEAARGATAYVTLEPCSHYGRTPPCADALIDAGVSRVVAAMRDPNPVVAGEGVARLELSGVSVQTGLLENDAKELNIGFVSRMTRGRPWVRLKVAASLDGKTALANGKSQWITGPDARRDVHAWRARSCAVLTGIGTVRDDDPRLTARDVETTRQPLRVVVDSRLAISPSAAILSGGNILIAYADAPPEKAAQLRKLGADVVALPDPEGGVDLPGLLAELGRHGINELMVEAGLRLSSGLLAADCVDELLAYQAPVLLGDKGRGMFDLGNLTDLAGAKRLHVLERRMVGPDQRILARFAP